MLKLTKLVHACLLIEKEGRRILADPGVYSWKSGVVQPEHLTNLSAVVVTHGHPDHLDEEFVKTILAQSPTAKWYGPEDAINQLVEWGAAASATSSDVSVRFVESAHAELSPWFNKQPDHTSFVVFNEILIGGDCHTLTSANEARVFGAAVNGGPWGAVLGFVRMIESMSERPEVVVPLHDWHWSDEARAGIYAQLPSVLEQFGVKFVALEPGVTQEV